MSIKIVAFGENEQVTKFGDKSRGAPSQQHEEEVIVENVTVAESHFLLFSVKEKSLVSVQATGANGLLFFLGGETPLFEEKQYLIDLLSSRVEFDGIPVAVIFERGQQLNLKDVVNYMELYRLKERASMIKEISWDEEDWLGEVYGWVKAQSEQSGVRGFQAAPKVVKMKAKYRESVEEESQKRYENLLDEKDVRGLGVKQQQDVYIQREKEKLKQENMDKQLANFSKNKKKMAPYDIKPTPNPKIEPNLHFFLKDPNSQPPPEVSIKIQTDEFKDRPAPPPYKPKKTGINTSTQIQEDQLFNFDKQVKPILAILTTKALESAALEIEQEQELAKMVKYKKAYEERVRKQKQHEQKNIDEEMRIIKEKDKLLQEHRQRIDTKKNIQRRVQCYQMASSFLSGVYFECANKLITANAYPDSLSNFLNTEYLDSLINKASVNYSKLLENQISLKGIFQKDVVNSLKNVASAPKEAREKIKRKKEARLINSSATVRKIHVLYRHNTQQFSNFSKHISKHFDNTLEEYIKVREEQIQQISDKVQGGQVQQEQLTKIKTKDSVEYAEAGHQSFLIKNNKEICFTSTSNRYQKVKESYISNGVLLLDKDGEFVQQLSFGEVNPKIDYMRIETGLRQQRENINMDEGIVIDLARVPEKVKSIVLLSKVTEVQKLRVESELKKFKHVAYGVQFWEHKIPIHSKGIGSTVKWQELVKAGEGEEVPSHNAIVVAYILRRRAIPQFWSLQDISYVAQPYKSQEQFNHFLEELAKFYYRSNDYLKEEEDEERVETSPLQKKTSKQEPRARSRKLIEEPKKKIVLKLATKILDQIEVRLDEPIENAVKVLAASVEEWKEFLDSCENGWQIVVKGKKLQSPSQLGAFKKIGDVLVKRIPKVQEPKIQKIEEQQGEKAQVEQ